MADNEYGIGGTERPLEVNEGFADLPQNKTLIIQKLTTDEAVKPEIVSGITSVDGVFAHFKPKVDAAFTGADGGEVKEVLSFNNLGDFGAKGLTRQSAFLQGLNAEQSELMQVVKQLRSNKSFMKAMQDTNAKDAVIEALKELAAELAQKK